MIRVTRWSPDTCGCVLEYEWDDAQDENTRQVMFKRVVKRCSSHSLLSGVDVYNEVVSENTRKNIVLAEAQKVFPELIPENYNWSFDKDRKLKVGFLGVAIDKKQLQDLTDSKFGKNKVEVI